MKLISLVVLGIVGVPVICGMYIWFHEPSGNYVDMTCVQLEVSTNVVGNCIFESVKPHVVLSFTFYGDGRYDVLYGDTCGATRMRSGEMDRKRLELMKAMPWKDVSSFWEHARRMEIVVATNSVVCMTQEDLDLLRYAVSNAIPVTGGSIPIDCVNPLVWKFISLEDANQFWKGE